jgi:hypothetical protein
MIREKIARTCNDSEDFVLIGDEATVSAAPSYPCALILPITMLKF